jgi:UV DNA damage repair endonuclease
VRFARSATWHRKGPHPPCHRQLSSPLRGAAARHGGARARSTRVVYLGDDDYGRALEVMAVAGKNNELLVIRAMELRDKYRKRYEDRR